MWKDPHLTFILTFWTSKIVYQVWYQWKSTAEWNITIENILEKRRIKVEKNTNVNAK